MRTGLVGRPSFVVCPDQLSFLIENAFPPSISCILNDTVSDLSVNYQQPFCSCMCSLMIVCRLGGAYFGSITFSKLLNHSFLTILASCKYVVTIFIKALSIAARRKESSEIVILLNH